MSKHSLNARDIGAILVYMHPDVDSKNLRKKYWAGQKTIRPKFAEKS